MSVFNKIIGIAGQLFAGLLIIFLTLLAGTGCIWAMLKILEMLGV